MLFSVIIPVYNVEQYLNECVCSVLNQGEKDIEIILVDDGSTDQSGKICDAFQEKYPETIRVIHKNNEGLLLTRRRGIKASKGEWIVHLDSDDYMMPGLLSTAKQIIQEHGDIDLLIGKVAYGDEDGKGIREYSKLPFRDGDTFSDDHKTALYEQLLMGGYMNAVYQKISKRTIVDVDADYSKYKRVTIAEDYLQSLPLLDRCKKAIFVNMPFVYYRVNRDSMTRKTSFKNAYDSFFSKTDVFIAEQQYLEKWDFSKDKTANVYAAHCRVLCRDLVNMAKAAETGIQGKFYLSLKKINETQFISKLFTSSNKKETGTLVCLCYRLLHRKLYPAVYMLCKYVL